MNKLAFVGPKIIHDAFAAMDPQRMDFQDPVESLDELQSALDPSSEGDGPKLAQDTSVIVLFSRLYTDKNKDIFVNLAAWLAAYSAVCILVPNADKEIGKAIEYGIKNQQALLAKSQDEEYDVNTPFYMISYEDAQIDLTNALAKYVNNPLAASDARTNILSSLPDNVIAQIQAENDTADEESDDLKEINGFDDEDVVIPEKSEKATGKVIAVTSSKGGSGKSTVSILLATYLAKGSRVAFEKGIEQKPLKVCVVDLDVRDGQLGFLNGAQRPNVVDILDEDLNPNEADIKRGIFHSKGCECDYIFAAKRPRFMTQIPAEFYANLIQKLREMYDYILIDTSVNYLDPLLGKVAYPIADKIVFVTDMGISSIFGMKRWIIENTGDETGEGPNLDPDSIGIVVNKVIQDVNMDVDKIQAAATPIQILTMLPSATGLILYAANTCSLDQVLNYPVINRAIKRLADSIVIPDGNKLEEVPMKEY